VNFAPNRPTAILSALIEEQRGLVSQLDNAVCVQRAGRDFWRGNLAGRPVVLALSRIGKVAAATTTTALIEAFDVARVVFTGVAGGVGPGVAVGDVVLGSHFLQHDMDASPLFPRFELPLYGRTLFAADQDLSDLLIKACEVAVLGEAPQKARLHRGLIASGDRFVSSAREATEMLEKLHACGHAPLAVEMECAAVAQVCLDYAIPFAAARTISDRADDQAHVDFQQFVTEVASNYSRNIVGQLMKLL